MSDTTRTNTTTSTDADAHGGPTMSEMAAGGTGTSGSGSTSGRGSTSGSGTSSSGTSRSESPAGPGQTGGEWREAVDSVGASEGLPGRVLGMLRDRPVAVGGAVLACVAVVVFVVVRMLRRS
jgi:hypothetical protein